MTRRAPQHSRGRYAPLPDTNLKFYEGCKVLSCICYSAMEVIEFHTPTRAPRSLYVSPWKGCQFHRTRLDRRGRRLRSPPSTIFSRSIYKRYGRIVVSILLIILVIVAGSRFVGLEAIHFRHDHEMSEAIMITPQPDLLSSAYAPPLPKPTWEDRLDEEGSTIVTATDEMWKRLVGFARYATRLLHLQSSHDVCATQTVSA